LARGPLRATASMQHVQLWSYYVARAEELALQTLHAVPWTHAHFGSHESSGDTSSAFAARARGDPRDDAAAEADAVLDAEEGAIQIRLARYATSVAPNGARFTLYHFQWSRRVSGLSAQALDDADDGALGGSAEPNVRVRAPRDLPREIARRFSDFVKLDGVLRGSVSPKVLRRLPALPSSLTVNKLGWWVVDARKDTLRTYLEELCSIPELRQHPEVRAFMQMNDDE